MKQCNVCLVDKEDSEFGIRKLASGNYTLKHLCTSCLKTRDAQRYASESKEEREKRIQIRKQWRSNNRGKVLALKKKYRVKSKIIKLASIPNDQHVKAYEKHKEKLLKQFLMKHDGHVKAWRSSKARIQKWSYKHNINVMLYAKLKRGIYRCLGDKARYSNWSSYLGYTIDELREHIEKRFTYGMSWENRHDWHIDHIVPLCAFEIESVDSAEFRACFGLHNLRPVWPDDNRDKYWMVDRVFNKRNKTNNVINQ